MITKTIEYLKEHKGKQTPFIKIAKGINEMPKWLKILTNGR